MPKPLVKKFGKYSVSLEVWTDAPHRPRSDCHISHTTRAGNEYTASLACAMDTGELTNAIYGEIQISGAILDEIEEWALANGY